MTGLTAALDELETAWRRKGSTDMARLRPGLEAEQIVTFLRGAGSLAIPAEVVEWFAWQNGPTTPNIAREMVRLAPSRFEPLSQEAGYYAKAWLSEGACSLVVADASQREERNPSFWWEEAWWPIAADGVSTFLAADLGSGSDTVAARAVEWSDPEGFRLMRARSLAAMVRIWLVVEDDYWWWSVEEEAWRFDPRKLLSVGAVERALF